MLDASIVDLDIASYTNQVLGPGLDFWKQAGFFLSLYGSFTRPLLPPAGEKQQLENLQGHDMFFKHLLDKLWIFTNTL